MSSFLSAHAIPQCLLRWEKLHYTKFRNYLKIIVIILLNFCSIF